MHRLRCSLDVHDTRLLHAATSARSCPHANLLDLIEPILLSSVFRTRARNDTANITRSLQFSAPLSSPSATALQRKGVALRVQVQIEAGVFSMIQQVARQRHVIHEPLIRAFSNQTKTVQALKAHSQPVSVGADPHESGASTVAGTARSCHRACAAGSSSSGARMRMANIMASSAGGDLAGIHLASAQSGLAMMIVERPVVLLQREACMSSGAHTRFNTCCWPRRLDWRRCTLVHGLHTKRHCVPHRGSTIAPAVGS